jgi:hypothetical protein
MAGPYRARGEANVSARNDAERKRKDHQRREQLRHDLLRSTDVRQLMGMFEYLKYDFHSYSAEQRAQMMRHLSDVFALGASMAEREMQS